MRRPSRSIEVTWRWAISGTDLRTMAREAERLAVGVHACPEAEAYLRSLRRAHTIH